MVIILSLIAGCIGSGEKEEVIDEGSLSDYLITFDMLPEGWYPDDYDYHDDVIIISRLAKEWLFTPKAPSEGLVTDYLEVERADFSAGVMTESGLKSTDSLHQSVLRYDSGDLSATVGERAELIMSGLEIFYADEEDVQFDIEYEDAPAVGDRSIVLKSTYTDADGPASTNYYYICCKDDILIQFQYSASTPIESLNTSYILNLMKNVISQD